MIHKSITARDYQTPLCEQLSFSEITFLCLSGDIENPVFDPEEIFEM